MCIRKLGRARFLPRDGSFNQQKVLSCLHPFPCSIRHCSHPTAPLPGYPEPPGLSRGTAGPEDAAAPAQGCSVLRGRQPRAAAAGLVLIRMELNLEQVLRDQWRFPHIKPLYGKADYPRPDVTFCSHCQLLHGAGMTVCTFLSFY